MIIYEVNLHIFEVHSVVISSPEMWVINLIKFIMVVYPPFTLRNDCTDTPQDVTINPMMFR
jgi:hypothetical protein